MAPNANNYVVLPSGQHMPKLGLGTWAQTNMVNRDQHNPKQLGDAVRAAILAGYRHIDTAWAYFNEKEIGDVLKELLNQGTVKREELFITTKLYPFHFKSGDVEGQVRKQLADLQCDYIDLMLMHSPIAMKPDPKDPKNIFPMVDGKASTDVVPHLDTWKALEGCVKKGLLKNIGVSNFNARQVKNLIDNAEIKPANLQVECHAYFPQVELANWCKENGVVFTAYSPIGSPGYADVAKAQGMDFPILMKEQTVVALAEKYKKSPAQILIRYLYDRDIVVIPKSTNPDRIKQNFDIFDFHLTPEEIQSLNALKKGRILGVGMALFKDHPDFPFGDPF